MSEEFLDFILNGFNSSTSTTGLPSGLETECERAAFQQSGFDPADNIIFCHQFEADDYYQVFIITLIMFLMYLGMYLLSYSQWTSFTSSLLNAKMSELITRKGYTELKEKAAEENERELSSDNYAGMPARLYICFNAILSCIYFLIKIVLITNASDSGDDTDNRYSDVNDRYKDDGFNNFVTAETIIMTAILVHNCANVRSTSGLYRAQRKHASSGCSNFLLLLSILIIWCDAIASFVMLCVYWSLLIYDLYMVAVTILVIIMLGLCFCCTLPICACFIVVTMKLFSLFACGSTESNFGKFMMRLGSAVSIGIIGYLITCLALVFQFLFVGGPNESIIFVNADDPNHASVIALFTIATVVGCISIITGFLCACRDQLTVEQQQQLTQPV